MIIFVTSSFLFMIDVKADYEAIVVNPSGSKCELYSEATGKCFYRNENVNSYVSGVVWFDTGDKVTVVESKKTIPTKNTNPQNPYFSILFLCLCTFSSNQFAIPLKCLLPLIHFRI